MSCLLSLCTAAGSPERTDWGTANSEITESAETSEGSTKDLAEVPAEALPESPSKDLAEDLSESLSKDLPEDLAKDHAGVLPVFWDLREHGVLPTVKSQGSYGTCWALAATTALELSESFTRVENGEPAGPARAYSADHMALQNGFDLDLDEGGDYSMIMAYLSGWRGPVPEEEDPYGDGFSPENLVSAAHVQEILEYTDQPREKLKKAIMDYGCIQTNLYLNRELAGDSSLWYKPQTAAYYYPVLRKANHDIVVLGWDDTFPRENFRTDPGMDGAWLCQNSWGTSFGQGGFFHVSYADPNICRDALAFARTDAVDNYDLVQQADRLGWQAQIGYGTDSCWMANVYIAGAYSSDRTESPVSADTFVLCAAGFYTTDIDTSYEIWFVSDFQDTSSFSDRVFLQKGSLDEAGYHTVDLEEPLPLKEGESYAVLVYLQTPGSDRPVAAEYSGEGEDFPVVLHGNRSFISRSGDFWESTQKRHSANVCLKCFLKRTQS